jgi:hypothetical protein
MIEFIETGASTYMRVQQAKDYFEKLYKCKAQVFVRGVFKDADGDIFDAPEWVPVRVESTAFGWHDEANAYGRYTFVGKFDYMIGAK